MNLEPEDVEYLLIIAFASGVFILLFIVIVIIYLDTRK